MPCPKCHGLPYDDPDGLRCLNCGWRPTISASALGEASDRRVSNRQSHAEICRRRYVALKKAGLCVYCGWKGARAAVRGTTLCDEHHARNRRGARA